MNIPGTQQQSSITCTLNIVGEELKFYHRTGRNANISSDGKSATRPNARGEFNDAIVMSNRPLRDNELFEVTIDKMVDRWSGSIEAGNLESILIFLRMKIFVSIQFLPHSHLWLCIYCFALLVGKTGG